MVAQGETGFQLDDAAVVITDDAAAAISGDAAQPDVEGVGSAVATGLVMLAQVHGAPGACRCACWADGALARCAGPGARAPRLPTAQQLPGNM